MGLATVGLVIETLADEQKLAAKRESPRMPVMDGLYSCLFDFFDFVCINL